MFAWILDTLTTCQSKDGVDIQSLVGKDTCSTFYLACLQLTTQHHEDIAVLALMPHPVFVLIVGNG